MPAKASTACGAHPVEGDAGEVDQRDQDRRHHPQLDVVGGDQASHDRHDERRDREHGDAEVERGALGRCAARAMP